MPRFDEIYNRVLAVNTELREAGYDWDYIEGFWNYCIEQSKNQSPSAPKGGARAQNEIKTK